MAKWLIKFIFNICLLAVIFLWANKTSELSKEYVILTALAIISLIFYSLSIYQFIAKKIASKQIIQRIIRKEQEIIEEFLENDFKELSPEEINELAKKMEKTTFMPESINEYREKFQEKIKKAKWKSEELKQERQIRTLNNEKERIEQEIKEKNKINQNSEERKEETLNNLDTENNKVFLTDDLTTEEIELLKEEGYKQVNEYDPNEKKVITSLVNPPLNHSTTHTFLVWSTIQYIKNNLDVDNLEEHETRDADITFKHKGKYYAIEIETGNLLKKQKQLAEKVQYLNNKYKNRWMFIISNKEMVSKYRKYGPSTHRKGMEENIEKMLENTHPPKTGGKDQLSTKNKTKKSTKKVAV